MCCSCAESNFNSNTTSTHQKEIQKKNSMSSLQAAMKCKILNLQPVSRQMLLFPMQNNQQKYDYVVT